MLAEFEDERSIVIGDLEAGVGTLLRMEEGLVDLVIVMCEPYAKSMEVASRAVDIAKTRTEVIVVANRVAGDDDVEVSATHFRAATSSSFQRMQPLVLQIGMVLLPSITHGARAYVP